jgi:REP element-mobilizing transposase RayT
MARDYLVFITWKTWASARSIDAELAGKLADALPRLAKLEHASLIEIAVMPNHVHVVAELRAIADVPRLAQRLKGATARFANRDGWTKTILRWDRDYDARTIGRGNLPIVRAYLDRQEAHHEMPLLARWSGTSPAEYYRNQLIPRAAS